MTETHEGCNQLEINL